MLGHDLDVDDDDSHEHYLDFDDDSHNLDFDEHNLDFDEHDLDDAWVPTEWRHLHRRHSVL